MLKFINKRINEALSDSKLDKDAKTGILLVSHGSRLKYNKEFISALFDKFEKSCDYPSNFGFMELAEPDIPTAIDALLENNEIDFIIGTHSLIQDDVKFNNAFYQYRAILLKATLTYNIESIF